MGVKVNQYAQGTLFISGNESGWSERYCLGDVTLSEAKTVMAKLANWRAAIMPGGFELVWCQVHNTDVARLAKAVIANPLPNLYDGDETNAEDRGFGKTNILRDAFHLRFEDADGHWANRLIRSIVDPEIVDDLASHSFPAATSPLPDAVPAIVLTTGPTYMQYVRNFAEHVKVNVKIPVRLKADPGGFKWELFPAESVTFRGVTTRMTGRPFGQSRGARPARIR